MGIKGLGQGDGEGPRCDGGIPIIGDQVVIHLVQDGGPILPGVVGIRDAVALVAGDVPVGIADLNDKIAVLFVGGEGGAFHIDIGDFGPVAVLEQFPFNLPANGPPVGDIPQDSTARLVVMDVQLLSDVVDIVLPHLDGDVVLVNFIGVAAGGSARAAAHCKTGTSE